MNSRNIIPLCSDVVPDGLYAGKGQDWPRCIDDSGSCQTQGCFWRRWHGMPPDKMRKPEELQQSLL